MKGIPRPTVKWQKDEEDLKEDTRVCVETTDISTILMIKQVQKDDAGYSGSQYRSVSRSTESIVMFKSINIRDEAKSITSTV